VRIVNPITCDVTSGTSGYLFGAYQYIISQDSTENAIVDIDGFEKRMSGNLLKPGSRQEKNSLAKHFMDMM
jgi:hypothetical protein